MRGAFVLPLYPLEDAVLLPGGCFELPRAASATRTILERARGFGGAVVASLADGESVHEIGVTALIAEEGSGEPALHGVSRCRLLSLVDEDVTLVRAERFPEAVPARQRAAPLSQLLQCRYERLLKRLGRTVADASPRDDLGTLTWRITAEIGLSPEQQQGFLNVPDCLTRAKLLLLAVRELERRERFLRPFGHMRNSAPWN